jgi:hypothetical protein
MNLPAQPFPVWIPVLLCLGGLLAVYVLHRAGARFLPRRIRVAIPVLRVLGLVFLILALLDPYWQSEQPDPSAYRVGILADTSRSMETRDLAQSTSRLEWVRDWLNQSADDPIRESLFDARTPVGFHTFSRDAVRWNPGEAVAARPGQTAIGESLVSVLESSGTGSTRLGGVLLLSDGINLHGRRLADAARSFNAEGIPVSVIGVGQSTSEGDVVVSFPDDGQRFRTDEAARISVNLENRFPDPREGTLNLYRNDERIGQRAVTLEPGQTAVEAFRFDPGPPGVATFRAEFAPASGGGNPTSHVGFSIAEIERSPVYRILLMAGEAGWRERLLRTYALEAESLRLDSLIRIDGERFFKVTEEAAELASGPGRTSRETIDTLPEEATFFEPYDVIILDTALAGEHAEALAPVLEAFAGDRGGGLLLLHSPDSQETEWTLPPALRNLFPVREGTDRRLRQSTPVEITPDPLYPDAIGSALFSDPLPSIPAGTLVGVPAERSRSARSVARTRSEGHSLLVAHAYGAGRTAWLGTDATWRWRLGAEPARPVYDPFWEGLLTWLAVGGKERLEAPANARMVPLDEPADLGVRILGPDYSPRMDATVRAVVRTPEGTLHDRQLLPVVEDPGRYELPFNPDRPGAYQVDYTVIFPEGDELRRSAWFAVSASSPESRRTAFDEKALRDLARLTGGRYVGFDNWRELGPLPLSETIPAVETRINWTRSWVFLLLALACLSGEWWVRRRNGLR